ncbi:MAG: DUF2608 domain-containing protein [Bdellovibrionales bacterium]|nr:DUF2608 domain-containing protein [Bdellovibrionales bacterium]
MKNKLPMIFTFVFLFVLQGNVWASQELTSARMETVEKIVQEKAKTYGAQNVIVAFDNDNTLLKMKQSLGSDQWWDWQSSMLFSKDQNTDKSGLVSDDFETLLDIQGFLFSLSSMLPVEETTPSLVKRIQDQGVQTFVLTSRGWDFYYPTIRELYENAYQFSGSLKNSSEIDHPRSWFPYETQDVAKELNLSSEQVKAFKLDRPARPVAFSRGIFFTAGQHKGAMMRVILHKLSLEPKAIVFVDDKEKHTKRMQEAFEGTNLDVTTVRYSAEDEKVEAFEKQDKSMVKMQWTRLQEAYASQDRKKIQKVVRKTF